MPASSLTDPRLRFADGADPALTVVMIEDHDMVAAALGGVLDSRDDLDVVAIATTVDEARTVVQQHQPDVIVTDLRLVAGDIIEHLPDLLQRSPHSRILVVTGAPNEKALLDALDAGVLGFIVKSQPMAEFVESVRRVGRGELVVAPELSPALMSRFQRRDTQDPTTLSRRELEVLELLSDGRGTDAIAAELILSPNTVRNHIARVMAKLDAHTRLEAVAEATRRGMIGTPQAS